MSVRLLYLASCLVLGSVLMLDAPAMGLSAEPATAATEPSWPQWGGPDRNFAASQKIHLDPWAEAGPKVLWKRDLGPGYAGIVVDGPRLLTLTRHGDQEVVLALDRTTGTTLWEHEYPAPLPDPAQVDTSWGAGPNATPLIADGRVIAFGFTGKLTCLASETGEVLWAHDLGAELGVRAPYFGHAASPLRYGDTVIVLAGGALAFDLASGELRWRNQEFSASYASPKLVSVQEAPEPILVAAVAGEIVGLDPNDGTLLWRHAHANQHRTFLSDPVVGKDRTLFASAYFLGSLGLELAADGRSVKKLWETSKLQLSTSNSLRLGDLIVGSHNSILLALDVHTGEILWRHRGFDRVNLLRAGDTVLVFDGKGKLAQVSISLEGVEVLSQAQILEGRSWTAPTLVGTTLFARNLETILALDLASSAALGRTVEPTSARQPEAPAPAAFLAARDRLERAARTGDTAALDGAGGAFQDWQNHPTLAPWVSYYRGFAGWLRLVESGDEDKDEPEGGWLRLLDDTISHLKGAVEQDPDLADAHALLSRLYPMYYRLNPGRGSVVGLLGDEHLETALRLEPDNPRVIALHGLDQATSPAQYGGDPEEALRTLQRAAESFDQDAQHESARPTWGHGATWSWYAQILRSLQRANAEQQHRDVIEALERALEIEPELATARELLRKVRAEEKAAGKAEEPAPGR